MSDNDEQERRWPTATIEVFYQKVKDPDLLMENARLAEQMGVSPPPTLYYGSSDENNIASSAGKSTEGNRYIVIDRKLSQEELRGVLAHEMGHHVLGHTDSASESVSAQREREELADAAALGICEGEGLALALEDMRTRQKNHAASLGVAFDTSKTTDDDEHPALDGRITSIRQQAKALEVAGECPVPRAMLADAIPALKRVSGGDEVAQNDAPNVNGDRPQQQGLVTAPPR